MLDPTTPIEPDTLRRARLAAYAYAVLPTDDPRRDSLRPDYLGALARHHRIVDELVPLLKAWADAGIDALIFKGFHLAEFVYPAPGMRFHGDVDVLVRPERVPEAIAVAEREGWHRYRRPSEHHHNAAPLRAAATQVDLHRYPVASISRWNRRQRRITEAMWQRSHPIEWNGVTVRLPAPVDAAVAGLALARIWSDRGYIKPHDLIDLRLLFDGGLTREDVLARARELACERSVRLFLDRCDPVEGRLEPVPDAADRLRDTVARVLERGALQSRSLYRLGRAPGLLVAIARVLPTVLAARRRIRRVRDLRDMLARSTPPAADERGSIERRIDTVRGIRWATRLFRLNPGGDCLLRSLAICTALRRQGWPVELVSGVRREGGRIVGHAWVELEGEVLPELPAGEVHSPADYRETLRWPPSTVPGSGNPST